MKSYFPNAACLYHALLFIDMKLSGSCTLTLWPSSLVTRSICYIGLDDFRCKWPIKHQERKKKYCIGEYRKQFYSVESLNLLKYSLSLFILVSFRIFSSLAFRTFLQHELCSTAECSLSTANVQNLFFYYTLLKRTVLCSLLSEMKPSPVSETTAVVAASFPQRCHYFRASSSILFFPFFFFSTWYSSLELLFSSVGWERCRLKVFQSGSLRFLASPSEKEEWSRPARTLWSDVHRVVLRSGGRWQLRCV